MPLTRLTWAATPLVALLALAACNGNGDDGDEVSSPTPLPTATGEAAPASELCPRIDGEPVQSLIALLELGRLTYQQGEPVQMTLRLINCASSPITRSFPSAQRYDFAARVEDGDEVWRWSEGMTFADEQGEETYQPGEEVTFSETWDQTDSEGQPLEPGRYELLTESTGCDQTLQECGPRASLFIEIAAP